MAKKRKSKEVQRFKVAKIKAEQGDADARDMVYILFVKTFKAMKIKAKKGNAGAQYSLSRMYGIYGKDVENKEEAKWLRKAAKNGHAEAQYWLGSEYFGACVETGGEGVPNGYKKATKWFRKAAKQGHAHAQYMLAGMYRTGGEGVPEDEVEAAKWHRKAAEQGEADAQEELGEMYLDGEGVPQDGVEAYAWFLLAKNDGNKLIREDVFSDLGKRLTAEQRKKGKARAGELRRLIAERKVNPMLFVESP